MVHFVDQFGAALGVQLRDWSVTFRFSVDVDDLVLHIAGDLRNVAFAFPLVASDLLGWIRRILK